MAQSWRLDHSTVLDGDGNPVAIIADPAGDGNGGRIDWPWYYDAPPPDSYAQAEDNAALIAAAPDLLEALKALVESIENVNFGVHDDDGQTYDAIPWAQAEDAIAKATGLA